MTRKIRRKGKNKPTPQPTPQAPTILRMVRLRKAEAMELQDMAIGDGLEAAKKHLRFLRPHLDEVAVHEVAWRCEDPRTRGGIQTGSDEEGEYADIGVTA